VRSGFKNELRVIRGSISLREKLGGEVSVKILWLNLATAHGGPVVQS